MEEQKVFSQKGTLIHLQQNTLVVPKSVIETEENVTKEERVEMHKRYVYDDLLNCYYDPQSNEYFQEM